MKIINAEANEFELTDREKEIVGLFNECLDEGWSIVKSADFACSATADLDPRFKLWLSGGFSAVKEAEG